MKKEDFPIFQKHKNLSYIDNASSTQKPHQVLDRMMKFYEEENANVHRGIYPLSEKATSEYELAREKAAKFINAETEEIVFTSGTTDGLNSLVHALELSSILPEDPKIISSLLEHHSNILPWQRLRGAKLTFVGVDSNFQLNPDLEEQIKNADIVALTFASNVVGSIVDLERISKLPRKGLLVIDAAQAGAHIQIDVKKLNIDFLVLSGHKMYGPTGIGVLYGKKQLLERIEPLKVGGGMIAEVNKDKSTWAPLPEKHEAGTPAIAQAVGLGAAIDYINEIGWEKIYSHEQNLRRLLVDQLKTIPEVEVYHPSLDTNALGVMSFNIKGLHPHDAGQIIAEEGVAVRAGHHCTQILHREVIKSSGSLRASIGIYNDEEDTEKLIKATKKAIEFFRKA